MVHPPLQEICLAARLKELSWVFFVVVVKYNAASLRPNIPRITMNNVFRLKYKTCQTEGCIKHAKDMHSLYTDDLSEAEAIELKKQFPLNFHERTRHILPAGSILQEHLNTVENFTINKQMMINE